MNTKNNQLSHKPESNAEDQTEVVQTLTPEAARALLRQLASFRFAPSEQDPQELADEISSVNRRLEYFAEDFIIPLCVADPDGVTAFDYSENNPYDDRYRFAAAREGWDEWSYDEIRCRPALTHATNSSLVVALCGKLKEHIERANANLAAARANLSIDESTDELDMGEYDGQSFLEFNSEDNDSFSCDSEGSFDDLSVVLNNGLGNVGWIALGIGTSQAFEWIDSSDEAVIAGIKRSAEERAIIDSLRLAGVPSYLTDHPLDEMVEGVNNVRRFEGMIEVAHEIADLFSDLQASPKTQRRLLTAAGCAKSLFFCAAVKDKGSWDECGYFAPEEVAEFAPVVNRCLGITPTNLLDDEIIQLAFRVPVDGWQMSAQTNDDGTHSIVWRGAPNESSGPQTKLEIEVSLAGAFNQRVKGVEVRRISESTDSIGSGSWSETIQDCFETRALYQLLSYFSKRAGKA